MEKYLGELCIMSDFYVRNTYMRDIKSDKDFIYGEALIFGKHLGGTMDYSESSFRVGKDCIAVTIRNDQEILLKYIYYYLQANKKAWKRFYVGTTLQNLSKVDLFFVKICYPSIDNQHHLVAIFDLLSDIQRNLCEVRILLYKFLASYYQYLKKVSGRFWDNYLKVSDIFKEYKKETKSKAEYGISSVVPFDKGLKITYNGAVHIFMIDKKKCNPYFLAIALEASGRFTKILEESTTSYHDISYLISQFSCISLSLPDNKVQSEFEKRYKQIERIYDDIHQLTQLIEALTKTLQSTFLVRGSKKRIWKNDLIKNIKSAIETKKYTIEGYHELSSLDEYDEKRDNLFGLLENGDIEQYFDATEGAIKFRGVTLKK